MPILEQWHDESHSILILTYTAPLDWGEFTLYFNDKNADVYQEAHPMCVIHIVEYIPSGSVLPHMKHILNVTPDRIVGAVIVPAANGVMNSLLTAMLRVISSVGRGKGFLTSARNREEALAMCEQRLSTTSTIENL